MANLEGESGELQATWVNADYKETGLPWQSSVPESEIDTLGLACPELPELLHRQLDIRRGMGSVPMIPVVKDGMVIVVNYIRRNRDPATTEASSLLQNTHLE